jgi:acyl-CoA synthetase (AMP-forming)/AMP-acid ligase II
MSAPLPATLPLLLDRVAEQLGERALIVDADRSLTARALRDEARAIAAALIADGFEHGGRAVIWAQNRWAWIAAALGVHIAGGAVVPLNTRFKAHEASWIAARAGATHAFVARGFVGCDYAAMLPRADVPTLRRIVSLDGGCDDAESLDAFVARGASTRAATLDARAAAVRGDDLSDLIFTSGTTGRPKGVMCTHTQTLRVFDTWAETVGLRDDDRYLIVPPFFHTFGYKAGWVACLLRGATIHPLPVFDVEAVAVEVTRHQITVMPGPPALYQSLLAHPRRAEWSLRSLRLAVTGAATVPVELVHRMHDELGFETVLTAYGLTESTGVVTMCRRDDSAEVIATTSGRAIDGVEVRLVDEAGHDVSTGQPGEVWVRGYNVMPGYFDDPAATAEAITPDGWLRTGDIAVADSAGNLAITDRKKDMFIVGGFNAYPAEIEATLAQHPDVAQVAVVGMPDDRLGEVGAAFVVLKPGAQANEAALIAFCRERMANYKVPRAVWFAAELPRNASGKVLKFELRERARTSTR